jgi:hypothetical protein
VYVPLKSMRVVRANGAGRFSWAMHHETASTTSAGGHSCWSEESFNELHSPGVSVDAIVANTSGSHSALVRGLRLALNRKRSSPMNRRQSY